MRPEFKTAIVVIITVAISVPSILVWASGTERFIFSQDLHVEEFKSLGNNDYAADVTDSGTRIANIYVRMDQPPANSTHVPILLSVWHEEDTEIDSVSLEFSTYPNYVTMYLEAQQGGFPETEFHRSHDAKGVICSVKDLGFYGTGTVEMNFILVQFPQYTYSQNELQLTAEFSMHRKTFLQLTSLKVQTIVDITIPS
jgi:hypothetical protein